MADDNPERPVYFIAHFRVDDVDGYRQYEKGFFRHASVITHSVSVVHSPAAP